MDINKFYSQEGEKPLDNLVSDGGFCGIFRTIGCIGDSLSSGEFESKTPEGITGYHDFYDYSWGQYIARTTGSKVYNFSKGGMTAKVFNESFGKECGTFDNDKLCQCYIIALGVNDIYQKFEVGNMDEISVNAAPNDNSFMSHYASIVRILKYKQPDAKFFFMTLPYNSDKDKECLEKEEQYSEAIRKFAEKTQNAYVLDFRKYAPEYDKKFRDNFFLGHMTATGYMLTAKMVMSYIDYIIRNNPADFAEVGFIGTPYKYRRD